MTWCTHLKHYCRVGRYFARITSDTIGVLWFTEEQGYFSSLHGQNPNIPGFQHLPCTRNASKTFTWTTWWSVWGFTARAVYPCRLGSLKAPCDRECSQTSACSAASQCNGWSLCLWSLVGLQSVLDVSQSVVTNVRFNRSFETFFSKKRHCNVWQKSTLTTPRSLLDVTSMPCAVNRAVVDWPSRGSSWAVAMSACGELSNIHAHAVIMLRKIASSG